MSHSLGQRTQDNPTARCGPCQGTCDHSLYGRKLIRFVNAHREAFETAYLAPDPRTSANELQRLAFELKWLPPRHDCSCKRFDARRGFYYWHCRECQRFNELVSQDIPISIGRGSHVVAPAPMSLMVDLHAGLTA